MNSQRWSSIQDNFDAALALAAPERAAFLARIHDAVVRDEVVSLLRAHDTSSGFMEQAAVAERALAEGTLPDGTCVGPWRIVRLIGYGGMGEVYEAARADGQFEQRAALKVTRREAAKFLGRFNAERQILARLDHPGVARLLDGGLMPDGRPYAVMEYVEGEPLLKHCDTIGADVRARLGLFMQVCRAVAHAHRNLIVHRDIKPNNVLVDREGRARLLDFGIAKPVGSDLTVVSGETAALLTPDYAAPEQLSNEPITTATDIYALGLLLFELLVGRRPWDATSHSLVAMVTHVLDRPAPKASAVASEMESPKVAVSLLEGDLDAIIARCLRREPEQRYATVVALLSDVDRSLQGEAIAARSGARMYVFGRFLRRYRWTTVGVVGVIAVLSVGIATTTWQARRAEREATRAAAVRDFLVGVFKASDPRVAQDKPRGQVTARELLDASVAKLEQQFANDPEVQIELMGVAKEIYRELDEPQRYRELDDRHLALARGHYGETHPIVLSALLDRASDENGRNNREAAQQLLYKLDPLIARAGAERTALRAKWLLNRGQSMFGDSAQWREQLQVLRQAVDLYAAVAPTDPGHVTALADIGTVHVNALEFEAGRASMQRAIDVAATTTNRNDAELATIYGNMGLAATGMGDFAGAEAAYAKAEQIILRTYGPKHSNHWVHASSRARVAHLGGDRERADRLFEALLRLIPADSSQHTAYEAREWYANCLAAEGRPNEAIPYLEQSERFYVGNALLDYELPRVRLTLADAYDRVGRTAEARKKFEQSLEQRIAWGLPDVSQAMMALRERWGRFLLAQNDVAGAAAQFGNIVASAEGRSLSHIAMAHGGLARVALARGDTRAAATSIDQAIAIFDNVVGFRDVRMEPYLWLVRSDVLLKSGDRAGALEWAKRALDARRKYDHPTAASIVEAEAAILAAARSPSPTSASTPDTATP